MGNAIGYLYGRCCKPITSHGSDGVSALAKDLFQFEITSEVPEGLGKHVVSSKKAQAKWYKKLLEAWREANPTPRTPEQATYLIVLTLKGHQKADVKGLLVFYGLPLADTLTPPQSAAEVHAPLPQKVQFELETLPVDAKAVADGDTVTVYVSTKHPREAPSVPKEVKAAVAQRAKARAVRNYVSADALHKKIIDAGYRMIPLQNDEEILAKKYRIRLQGIDAPESAMPYGKEAKEELTNMLQGQCLRVLVSGTDMYNRCVGDIYCKGKFVQEVMLKKGLAWHYTAYDKRVELAKWEKDARDKRVGLWGSSNPEKPWDWRRNKRGGR